MRALYATAGRVPLARVLREHRAALLPLGVVLAINLVALGAVVVPLAQRSSGLEERALAAERTREVAEADYRSAEALRESNGRANDDLGRFYRDVLPANVAAARRVLQLRLRQQAESHGVEYQGSGTTEEVLRDSNLLRLAMSMRLAGSYDDIRGFIHELESATDFVVIEQIRLSEATGNQRGLELALDVSTYYRQPGAAVKASNDGR